MRMNLSKSIVWSCIVVLMCMGLSIGIFFFVTQVQNRTGAEESVVPRACTEIDSMYTRVRCLIPYFTELAHTHSVSVSLKKAMQLQKEGVIDDCHSIAHAVGSATFDYTSDAVGEAFASCTLGCLEGCFHGVMERYLEREENVYAVMKKVPETCAYVGVTPLLERQCIHGIGHGIMKHGATELGEGILLCKQLPTKFAQDTCLGGVFMEHMNSYLSLNEEVLIFEINEICGVLQQTEYEALMPACMSAVGEGLMFYTGHDLERSMGLCLLVSDEREAEYCRRGVEEEKNTVSHNSQ